MPARGAAGLARDQYAAGLTDDFVARTKADDPQALRKAAREFESLLVHQLFQSMRATLPEDEDGLMDGGFGGQVFTDMLDSEYARMSSEQGGFGLGDLVAEQLGGGPAMGAPHAAKVRAALRSYGGQPLGNQAGGFQLPVAGHVSSGFGVRQLANETEKHNHPGLDFAAPIGTPIRAAAGGRVVFAGEKGGYGNAVVLDHGNGVETLYGHASELLVMEGDVVPAGTPIAKVGSTGYSTGPHLHFEIRREGRAVDPAPALGLR